VRQTQILNGEETMPDRETPEPKRIKVRVRGAEPEPEESKKPFLTTLPGLLTAIGAIVGAAATMITALSSAGIIGEEDPTATPTASLTPVPSSTLTPTPTGTHTFTAIPPTSSPTPTDTPMATSTPAPSATRVTTWRFDFGAAGDWPEGSDDTYRTSYADGEYRIEVIPTQFEIWNTTDSVPPLGDLVVEVDGRWAGGTLDNDYGLLIRRQPEIEAFYMFVVSSDGYYKVLRRDPDTWVDLMAWSEATGLASIDSANRLRVEAIGSLMRFSVNGVLQAEVFDATYGAGGVGLVAGTGDEEAQSSTLTTCWCRT
jgi:hypothetical protein